MKYVVDDIVWQDIFAAYEIPIFTNFRVVVACLKQGLTLRDMKGRVFRYFG